MTLGLPKKPRISAPSARVLCLALASLLWMLLACGGKAPQDLLSPQERQWLKQNQGRLVLGIETQGAPLVFLDEHNQPAGLAHDHLRLLEAKLGVQFQQRPCATLDTILEQARRGEIQVVNAVTPTATRATFLSFTRPYLTIPNVILVRKDRPRAMNLQALRGQPVSLVRQFAVTEYLLQQNLGLVPTLVPNDLTALLDVSFGRSEATVLDLATASYLIQQKGITNLQVAGDAAFDIHLAMATPRGEAQLFAILQKGLGAITEAERQEIRARWINATAPSVFMGGRFWAFSGGLLGLLLLVITTMVIWNRTLKREVALRTQALAEEKAALQESEARHRAILQASPDAIVITDLDGRMVMVSPATCAIFGAAQEADLIGQRCVDLIAPEDRHRAAANVALKAQGMATGPNLYRGLRLDGSTFDMEVNSNFIRTPDGQPARLVIVIRDTSAKRQVEEALHASRELFSKAFEVSPDAFAITTLEEGLYLGINEGFTRILGFTREELLGRSSVSPERPLWAHSGERERLVAGLKERGEVIDLEATFLKKDRTPFTGLVSAKAFELNGAKRILSITRDITERKRAETALRASEQRLADILNSINSYVFIKDLNYRYTYANPMVCQLFGRSSEEILGRGDEAFFSTDSLEEIQRSDRPVLEQGERVAREESNLSSADGIRRTFWTVKIPLRDEQGQIYGLCGVSTDITTLKQAEAEQRQLQAQLQQTQKMESLGSLASGVAHDMNNVLGAILGLASAHLEVQPPGTPVYRAFETISRAALRGGQMVKGLLSFARLSPAEERELDLNAILQEEVRLLERTTLARVRLELDLASDLHPMRGDASALTHAFMNLCVNAVDAMPENGTLILKTQNLDGHWIEVSVQDTGSGMAKEVLAKAMDPFFTTKAQGKGTGLGLSMVYSTVKAHRGQMEIQSEPGRGTCVKLRFPACEPILATPPSAAPQDAAAPRKRCVLLVDDDELIRSSVQMMLEALGHQVITANSGEEALEQLAAGASPDGVILDVNMPGLGGAGTLPRLRALRPTLPVLLATGRTDQTALDLIQAHPFVTLLPKPFTLSHLQQHLDDLM